MTKILEVRFQSGSGSYRYASSKSYNYTYDGDRAVEKDDLAVVDSPYGGPTVVTVVSVRDKTNFDSGLKTVMEVISLAAERNRKANEAKRKKLKAALAKRLAAVSETLLYERLAEKDPEAAKLLAELKAIDG